MQDQLYLWAIFGIIIIAMLALDLGFFQRRAHALSVKEALKMVAFWVSLAIVFDIIVYFTRGADSAFIFITAYLIEYSLSVDNLFVFLAIFTYFVVPAEARRRVLLWGILGAVFFRGIFIFAGITLIQRFHFLVYVLGLVLVYAAVRLITQQEKEVHPEKNPLVRLAKKLFRVDAQYDGARFLKRRGGLLYATPLLIVLIAIESTDIMFAVDSVPAVLAVTFDPFIVYTSNIFAILGLRALFFVLDGMIQGLRYLTYGLCAILLFVAIKMFTGDILEIPVGVALGVTAGILLVSVLASVLWRQKETTTAPERGTSHQGEE